MTAIVRHHFKHQLGGDCRLVCPQCREQLHRDDIEHFGACPYCNALIEFDREVENFLLQPVVNHWLAHQMNDPAQMFIADDTPAAPTDMA